MRLDVPIWQLNVKVLEIFNSFLCVQNCRVYKNCVALWGRKTDACLHHPRAARSIAQRRRYAGLRADDLVAHARTQGHGCAESRNLICIFFTVRDCELVCGAKTVSLVF